MQLKHLYLLNKSINIYIKHSKISHQGGPKILVLSFPLFVYKRNFCLFFNLFFNKSLHPLVLQKYSCTTIEAWLTFAVLSIHNIEAYSIVLANFGTISKQLEAQSFLKFKFQVMDLMDFKMSTSTCICFCWYTTV